MPEAWTGRLVGRMHLAGIKQVDLARELGYSKVYISQILNGKANPPRAEERLEEAFQKLMEKKGVKDDGADS